MRHAIIRCWLARKQSPLLPHRPLLLADSISVKKTYPSSAPIRLPLGKRPEMSCFPFTHDCFLWKVNQQKKVFHSFLDRIELVKHHKYRLHLILCDVFTFRRTLQTTQLGKQGTPQRVVGHTGDELCKLFRKSTSPAPHIVSSPDTERHSVRMGTTFALFIT